MKLHSLVKSHKRSQRIGRGGKRGTTAGRGTKGQRSLAGHRIRPAERDLILRSPKHRGLRNKPKEDRRKICRREGRGATVKSYAKGKAAVELTKEILVVGGWLGKKFKG